jgi:hypothetical protein
MITGSQLAQYCREPPTDQSDPADDWKGFACVGFIYGFTAAHQMTLVMQADAKHPDDFMPLYCAPHDTSVGEYQTVFSAFAIANPDKLSGPAEHALFAALATAFPCPWLQKRIEDHGP